MDIRQKERQIRFDFQEAMNRAEELDGIAAGLERARSGLGEALQPLAVSWEGESAELYQGKGEKLRAQLTASAKDLRYCAEEVRRAARKLQAVELANLQLILQQGGG